MKALVINEYEADGDMTGVLRDLGYEVYTHGSYAQFVKSTNNEAVSMTNRFATEGSEDDILVFGFNTIPWVEFGESDREGHPQNTKVRVLARWNRQQTYRNKQAYEMEGAHIFDTLDELRVLAGPRVTEEEVAEVLESIRRAVK